MEKSGKQLDIDGGEVNGTSNDPVATYKPIPEEDFHKSVEADQQDGKIFSREDTIKLNMSKQNADGEIDDGAQERMLKDDGRINSNKDATEVKFNSENGDAKIDIDNVKETLAGMGKEELMKFANDPFWVKLRWFMFITFWLIWLGMLAGAIVIIVMAPKCSAPQPKKWWEESPIIRLEASDAPGGNLKGIQSLLDSFKVKNIKAILLPPIMRAESPGHIIDFKDIEPQLGSIEDFKNLIAAAKEREQHIVLELDPNHSSLRHIWFNRSVEREEPYTSYYVWSDGKSGTEGKPIPVNNWLSVNGGSAWAWNDVRKQFYLHQFNETQPDFNFRSEAVIKEFSDILMHWLKLGVSGFRLADTRYLLEDSDLSDEAMGSSPARLGAYESLMHLKTKDLAENANILRQWREMVANQTGGAGLFTLKGDIAGDTLAVFNETTLVDLPQNSKFLATAVSNISATAIQTGVQQWLKICPWPGWDLNGEQQPLRNRMTTEQAESLTLMTLLLPGTPILSLNDTESPSKAFVPLSAARSGSTFLYGETKTDIVNGTVFVYTRLKSGNPGYLVAYQSGEEQATVDLSHLPQVSSEVSVVAHSSNYAQDGIAIKSKIPSNMVHISPKSTLVLTFVPKV